MGDRALTRAAVAALVLAALGVVQCGTSERSTRAPGGPEPLPEAQDKPGATCLEACSNLERLGCPEAEPTEGGASCVEVCRFLAGSEIAEIPGNRIRPGCLAAIQACDLVERCR